jgi:1-acyl-sn-glycerol-3-phosphate acyltransferase
MSVGGAARSLLFCVTYLTHLLLVMGPVQALILGPWVRLRPARAAAVWGAWQRAQSRWCLALARTLAGARFTFEGRIPPVACVVVMNHQSLLDIPIAFSLVDGPTPLIVARDRYFKVPVIGDLLRLVGHPLVAQGRAVTATERAGLENAATLVGRGERSLLIFPEGHRSAEGRMRPFMTGGLRLVFARAPQRPVYLALIEGLAHVRTFADVALRMSGTHARITIDGPFDIPADPSQHDVFIASLHERLLALLAEHRGGSPEMEPADASVSS